MAKTILKEQGREYTFIDVAENEDTKAAFFKKFPNVNKVPQIMYDGKDRGYPVHVGGYKELEAWVGARYKGDRK